MATNTGDLYVNIKADIKDLKKGLNQATKEIKSFGGKMSKSTKQNENFFKSFAKGRNDVVRLIRQLETLAVASFAVHAAYKLLIGSGLELNKQYQDQSLGIAALISSKTKMIDQNGKELSSYESFIATQAQTKDVMDDIKKASLDTPASFQQMVEFYQQAIGHAISANGTFGESIGDVNKNVITMTQGMSALGSSMGMEMKKVNEEIRSLMSGNASTDSLLALVLFGSPSAANEAVRNAKKTTNGLSNLILDALKPFKNVQGVMTYSKAVARLGASFDEMQKGITAELFEDLTYVFVDLKKELDGGLDEFIQDWKDVYNTSKAFFDTTFGALSDMGSALFDMVGYVWEGVDGFDAIKVVAITIAGIIKLITKAIAGITNIMLRAKGIANDVAKTFKLGDYAEDAAWSARDLNTLDRLEGAANPMFGDASAQDEKNLKIFKERMDKKYNAETNIHKAKIAEQEKELKEAIDKSYKAMMAPIDIGGMSDKYDAVKNANPFLQGMRDSYKGAENLDQAMQSIAASTQAAVEAANGDVDVLKRIGIEAQKVVKYAEGEFLARNSTSKLLGNSASNAEKEAKALAEAEKAAKSLYKEYLRLTDKKLELFQFDVSETLNKFASAGYSGEKLSEIYDGMWKKHIEAMKKDLTDIQEFYLDLGRTLEGAMVGAFRSWQDGALNFKETMSNVLKDIAAMIFQQLVIKQLFSGLGGLFGGFGGILGAFADGGTVGATGSYLVGEEGPEVVTLPAGAHVTPNDKLGGTNVNVNVMNYGNDNVRVEQKGDNINIIISQIASSIQRGTGDIGKAIEGRYGVRKV